MKDKIKKFLSRAKVSSREIGLSELVDGYYTVIEL